MISVFLSDIHLNYGASTDWYQKSVHQDCLKSVLRYIMHRSNEIEDVVVLGDWFDQWITPSFEPVPNINRILKYNIDLFRNVDNSGDFTSCMDMIQGDLYYINGNHDMNISVDKINAFVRRFSKTNKKIMGNSDPALNTHYTTDIIHAEHGHLNTLSCSPYTDKDNKYSPLPFAYYISRIVTHLSTIRINNSKVPNSAYLPHSGSPIFSQDNLIESFNYIGAFLQDEITAIQAIYYALIKMTGYQKPEKYLINMFNIDGSFINAKQAAEQFDNMSLRGNFQKFLTDIYDNFNAHAEIIGKQSQKIIIMGHTHDPMLKRIYAQGWTSLYVNCGYLCADIPGMEAKKEFLTFVEVEDVKGGYEVRLNKVNYPDGRITTIMKNFIFVK